MSQLYPKRVRHATDCQRPGSGHVRPGRFLSPYVVVDPPVAHRLRVTAVSVGPGQSPDVRLRAVQRGDLSGPLTAHLAGLDSGNFALYQLHELPPRLLAAEHIKLGGQLSFVGAAALLDCAM
ncbi:MAG TPA: hypothetical protein VN085_06575 [Vicinamibacterales bacterium]|nr:hypothetical protein [Vicinamibacterales bacterium]